MISLLRDHSSHDTEHSFVEFAISQCDPNNDSKFLVRFTESKRLAVRDNNYASNSHLEQRRSSPISRRTRK
jgi:hypothetical protein